MFISHNATFHLKVKLHKHILNRISFNFMGVCVAGGGGGGQQQQQFNMLTKLYICG